MAIFEQIQIESIPLYAKQVWTVLAQTPPQELPDGNIRYLPCINTPYPHENSPLRQVLFSPKGRRYLSQDPALFRFLHSHCPWPNRHWVREGEDGKVIKVFTRFGYIAIKKFVPNGTISGLDQFQALQALREKGAASAYPLAATPEILLTEWVHGFSPYAFPIPSMLRHYQTYIAYLKQAALELKQEGKWQEEWEIDESMGNYRIGKLSHPNPLQRFTTFDPIYLASCYND